MIMGPPGVPASVTDCLLRVGGEAIAAVYPRARHEGRLRRPAQWHEVVRRLRCHPARHLHLGYNPWARWPPSGRAGSSSRNTTRRP